MAAKAYRYANYTDMMATPNERWRLIIAASFLLHLMLICGIDLELGQPVTKPQPKTIALILQKAPVILKTTTPPPDLTVKPESLPALQTVAPVTNKVISATPKTIKPISTSAPEKHRYIKAPVVQPKPTMAKIKTPKPITPSKKIRPQAIEPAVPSIGIPMQANQPIAPTSPIPDNLSNIPSIGVPVIAAPTPKPKTIAPKPQQIAKAAPTPKVVANIQAVKTPLETVQTHQIKVHEIETVEARQAELDTEDLDELEPTETPLADLPEQTVETETVEARQTELKPLELPKLPHVETPIAKTQAHQIETVPQPNIKKPETLSNSTRVSLENVQPHQVQIAVVRPIFLSILESFLKVLEPLTEIVQTARQSPSTTLETTTSAPQPPTTTEKIPEQFMSNDWQRTTKQAVQDHTAKELADNEREEKLGKLVFREQKDYGDLPEPMNDNQPKNNTQKRKDSKLGIKLGDSCFLGFQSEKEDSRLGKKRNTMIPIDCNF